MRYKQIMFSILEFFMASCIVLKPEAKAETTAVLCSSGACEAIPPEYAALALALDSLVTELNKGNQAFGPSNEIVKAISSMGQLLSSAFGPDSHVSQGFAKLATEISNAPQNATSDLQHGWSDSNEIRKFLNELRIKW